MNKTQWKKIITREYSFLFVDYMVNAYEKMKRLVGTTLTYNLFKGHGKFVTIYRIEEDIKQSYLQIEKLILSHPQKVIGYMVTYEVLVKQVHDIIIKVGDNHAKNKKETIILFDKLLSELLCYYLFFVYLGYAAHLPQIKKFLDLQEERFKKIRSINIDVECNQAFKIIFGMYSKDLGELSTYMKRKEIFDFMDGKQVNRMVIEQRKERYLRIMKKGKTSDYSFVDAPRVLERELPKEAINQSELHGNTAYAGLAVGRVVVVFDSEDMAKVREGDMLVTPMTKPHFIPVFSKISGIITNDGGTLSHASIIAREMGIPCITGTTHATDVLKDGDTVLLDAYKGIARKV